jgi:DNA polymerase
MAAQTAADFVPDSHDLDTLSGAAEGCKGCDLYLNANQTVFGAGAQNADMMLVGEQPGDQEDKAGAPFVGPAGKLLDKALVAAGVDRDRLYVTNAVKHFKFTLPERGKRRIHKTPSRTEVVACRPWLLAEMMSVQPDVVVLLGATAAQSLMGSTFRLTAHRGEILHLPVTGEMTNLDFDPEVVVSAHPSSVLRGPPKDREKAFEALVSDLRFAAGRLTHKT